MVVPHDHLRKQLAAEAARPDDAPLASAMAENPQLTGDDHIDLLRLVAGVRVGSAYNGYTMARLMGLSASEARANPATAPLLEIRRWIGGEQFPGEDCGSTFVL